MHKLQLASVLAAGILSAAAASADSVTLNFNGVTNYSSVADFYNGGTDTAGASGTNYNASFTGGVIALSNDGLANTANGNYFNNAPTSTVIFANAADTAILNVNSGFNSSFQVTYSSTTAPTTLNVWSGLNDTGTLLGTLTLAANSNACGTTAACTWTTQTLNFNGEAQSVDFSSNAGNALFTNISYAVPLPASGLLMAFGLGGLALFGTRRRAA